MAVKTVKKKVARPEEPRSFNALNSRFKRTDSDRRRTTTTTPNQQQPTRRTAFSTKAVRCHYLSERSKEKKNLYIYISVLIRTRKRTTREQYTFLKIVIKKKKKNCLYRTTVWAVGFRRAALGHTHGRQQCTTERQNGLESTGTTTAPPPLPPPPPRRPGRDGR